MSEEKAKALCAFQTEMVEDYDLHRISAIALPSSGWPDAVRKDESDWGHALFVGWMNGWQARAGLAAEREAALKAESELIRSIVLDAYRAGAITAHEDTVEGRYNMAHAPDSDAPQEWLDDYLVEAARDE